MPEGTSVECTVYDVGKVKEMGVLICHVYFAFQSVIAYLS